MSIIGGIAFGVLCGYLVKYIPERNDAFMVPLRVLLLLSGGLMSVLGSEEIGWGGAGKDLVRQSFTYYYYTNTASNWLLRFTMNV